MGECGWNYMVRPLDLANYIYSQPHSPVNFSRCTRKLGQTHGLVIFGHSFDLFVWVYDYCKLQIVQARAEELTRIDVIEFIIVIADWSDESRWNNKDRHYWVSVTVEIGKNFSYRSTGSVPAKGLQIFYCNCCINRCIHRFTSLLQNFV